MYVVDSSIFSSIIVKDEFYDRALNFLVEARRSELVTLDLAIIETANTLWKHACIYKRIPVEKYRKLKLAVESLVSNSVWRVYATRDLIVDALNNALKYRITVYDSAYITLALKKGYRVATFDKKLEERLREQNLEIIYMH